MREALLLAFKRNPRDDGDLDGAESGEDWKDADRALLNGDEGDKTRETNTSIADFVGDPSSNAGPSVEIDDVSRCSRATERLVTAEAGNKGFSCFFLSGEWDAALADLFGDAVRLSDRLAAARNKNTSSGSTRLLLCAGANADLADGNAASG